MKPKITSKLLTRTLTDKKTTIVTRKCRPKWAGTKLQLLSLG